MAEHSCDSVSFCEKCKTYLLGPNLERLNHQCGFLPSAADKCFPRLGFLTIKTHRVAKKRKRNDSIFQTFYEEAHAVNFIFESSFGNFAQITFLDERIIISEDIHQFQPFLFERKYFEQNLDLDCWPHNTITVKKVDLDCLNGSAIQKFLQFLYNNKDFKNTSILSFDGSKYSSPLVLSECLFNMSIQPKDVLFKHNTQQPLQFEYYHVCILLLGALKLAQALLMLTLVLLINRAKKGGSTTLKK